MHTYLTTAEVADILHVSPKTVTRWAREGKLPHSRTLGGHRRYPGEAIRQLATELAQLREDAGRVGTIMPMNTRPKAWFWEVVANFAPAPPEIHGCRDASD